MDETVVFECIFSGTPTPGYFKHLRLFDYVLIIIITDIIWYHNDKIIRNSEKVKVRIEKNRTTCTVKTVSQDNAGVYLCKAVSDAGMVVTKAKLYVQDIPLAKKKDLEEKVAQQQEETVKKERVKIEKKVIKKKSQKPSLVPPELEETLEISETRPLETTEQIKDTIEEDKAKPVLPVHSPLQTEAVATCKKIDDSEEIIFKEKAEEVVSPVEPLYIEESTADELTKEFKERKPKPQRAAPEVTEALLDTALITEVKLEQIIERVEEVIANEDIKMAKEITELLETINAKEFGPGEYPLREIAEIGYLLRNGITTKEITVLYNEEKFPSLKTTEAQSALVSVIERKGYGPLISEVFTEEKTVDEKELAATVGFRAFMKMIDRKHVTVEEVITYFKPDDFIHHIWQSTEMKEVCTM